MNITITSGGTIVPIDDIRCITNFSRGTLGVEMAKEMISKGHNVTLIRSKHSKSPLIPDINLKRDSHHDAIIKLADCCKFEASATNYKEVEYTTYDEYRNAVCSCGIGECDVFISAAAVSDFRCRDTKRGKINSSMAQTVVLDQLPKVLKSVSELNPKTMVIGFKLFPGRCREYPQFHHVDKADQLLEYCHMVLSNYYNDLLDGTKKFCVSIRSNILGLANTHHVVPITADGICDVIIDEYTKFGNTCRIT